MIAEPGTYSVADFIPFTAEVYLRLFERQNEAQWPLHLLAVAAGAATIALAWRGRDRRHARWAGAALSGLLAAAWLWVALSFHLRLYTELTWVAWYIGGAFIIQAGLILVAGVMDVRRGAGSTGRGTGALHPSPVGVTVVGYALAALGVVVYPLLAPLTGQGWAGAQCFAIAPDPTAVATLGLLLLASRPRWLALLLPIPLLWLMLSSAVGTSLELPLAWLPAGAAAIALAAALWSALPRRHATR